MAEITDFSDDYRTHTVTDAGNSEDGGTDSSKGRHGKDTAITFREAARSSIGSHMPAKSLELKHAIKLIQELTIEIGHWHKRNRAGIRFIRFRLSKAVAFSVQICM